MFFFLYIYAILKVPINDFIELKILEKEIGIKFVNIIETSQKVNFGKKIFLCDFDKKPKRHQSFI